MNQPLVNSKNDNFSNYLSMNSSNSIISNNNNNFSTSPDFNVNSINSMQNSMQNFQNFFFEKKAFKEPVEDVNSEVFSIPNFPLENKKSTVIYVRGINANKVNPNILLNLFSNFGSIIKILILKLKSVALIEYESIEYASQAKNFLNNTHFFGSQMKVF